MIEGFAMENQAKYIQQVLQHFQSMKLYAWLEVCNKMWSKNFNDLSCMRYLTTRKFDASFSYFPKCHIWNCMENKQNLFRDLKFLHVNLKLNNAKHFENNI